MPTDFTSILHALGMTESEAKTYLAGLKLGAASVQDIAKAAKLSRTAAYDAIENLKSKELFSTYQRGKKTLYVAEEPDRLLQHLQGQQLEFSNKVSLIEKKLDDLILLAGGERPKVRFFQGTEMFYAFFDDVCKKKPKEMYELSNVDELYKHFTKETVDQARQGMELKNVRVYFMHSGDKIRNREMVSYCKVDKKDIGEFKGDVAVYDDTVVMVSFEKGGNMIVIENKDFAATQRALLKGLWNKYNK